MLLKNALYITPVVLIIGVGLYWYFKNSTKPIRYFSGNANQLAKENTYYRNVLYTTKHSQLTLMAVPIGTDIPKEIHKVDQIFVIVEGSGKALVDGSTVDLAPDTVLIVPARTEHTISNTGNTPLKLYTFYAPPQHPAGTIDKTREDESEHS